jgi:hypothetical protein
VDLCTAIFIPEKDGPRKARHVSVIELFYVKGGADGGTRRLKWDESEGISCDVTSMESSCE